jgi:hypothetical protein
METFDVDSLHVSIWASIKQGFFPSEPTFCSFFLFLAGVANTVESELNPLDFGGGSSTTTTTNTQPTTPNDDEGALN